VPYRELHDPDQLQALLGAVIEVGADLEMAPMLRRVVEVACALTGARYGALGVLDISGKSLAQFVHVGVDDETVARIGHLPDGAGILGLLILDPKPLRLAEISAHPDSVGFPPGHPPMHSFLGVPLRVRGEVFGNLYLTEKIGAPEFSSTDEALVVALASAVASAIDNARLYARVAELVVSEDRERIARDLHDTVIQRLFATGLSLQSVVALAPDRELRARLEEAVADLDDTIRQVRMAIFALEPPPTLRSSLRARVLALCADSARALGFEPAVHFSGPIDTVVGGDVASELLATLREALANVARHAGATSAEVELSVDDHLHLTVTDDGVGIGPGRHRTGNGLPNMATRAELLGGSFSLSARPEGGTELTWRVPLAP
jgi:signal transduction histidine kinase